MDDPINQRGTLNPFARQWLGEALRGWYHLPTTLPPGVYDLMMRLDQCDGRTNDPKEPDQRRQKKPYKIMSDERGLVPPSKENDYRQQAVETMRLAQQTSSSSAKSRLVNLAEAWIELAEKVHKVSRSFRS